VLHRPLALKLLAPTVLVSLLLVAACAAAALYLGRLQVDVSGVLSEHIDSTLAAANLYATVGELLGRLRGDHGDPEATTKQIAELNDRAAEQLGRARALANLDEEKRLVGRIGAGLDAYRKGWEARGAPGPDGGAAADAALARGLEEGRVPEDCVALRDFNLHKVGDADRDNRTIVWTLTGGLLAVGVAAPLCGLALGYAVARSLHHSIHQLSVRIRDAAGRLSGGPHAVVVNDVSDLPGLNRQMQGVVEEIERVVGRLQQREREVLRSEQLAAVGQVAAGVAHELRNPLTSVKMLVQTGLEGAPPAGLPPEDLAVIEGEVRRMEACIQTFLDFARPPHTERRRADLAAVVRRALALVEGRARRQKVVCTAELPEGPLELDLDPGQVQQVLVNLLLNALDAQPQGGRVRVTVRGPTAESPFAAVQVQDDGPGIAPGLQERLFRPFVSTKETGLGLGLSICRRLVEAHGGAIHGANAPEGGALFAFTLPV
jgi:signal transduction histidine kinase